MNWQKFLLGLFFVITCGRLDGLAIAAESPTQKLPHVVILYADDLGYGDVACFNPQRGKIPTPHIDRLAAQGMRFTDAHSSSGVCSPSRYTLLTGRYHWRTRLQRGIVGQWGAPLIAEDRITLAGLLHQVGYHTSCVGKWHLGWDWPIPAEQLPLFKGSSKTEDEVATAAHRAAWQATFSQEIPGGPITRGFDEYFGTDVPNWPPFCFIDQNRTQGIPSEFLPARLFEKNQASVPGPALADWKLEPILPTLAERAVTTIAQAAQQDRPLFLYMPLTAPHTPLAVNAAWQGKSGLNLYADFVMETDAIVGQVLDALDKQGLADQTLVIFTSDNGCAPYIDVAELEAKGHYPSGPLRGYKSDVWEGGHRVPFIVRWPGKIAAQCVCDRLVHQADVMATVAEIAQVKLPDHAGEDSFSLLPLFNVGADGVRPHAVSQSAQGLLSIRQGAWKLIFGPGSGGWTAGGDDQPAQLYNLDNDLGETENLASSQPEKVIELTELMQKLVEAGRSTPGKPQANDQAVDWKQFMH